MRREGRGATSPASRARARLCASWGRLRGDAEETAGGARTAARKGRGSFSPSGRRAVSVSEGCASLPPLPSCLPPTPIFGGTQSGNFLQP